MFNKIINKDCFEGLKELPENSINMIVTSPPYFVGKKYSEGADYENFKEFDKEWTIF